MTPVIRVFLVDDHEIVRLGIRELLATETSDIRVVGEASTLMGALLMCPRVRPDVAIIDLRLQTGSGIDVCREIRVRCPGIACLIFTSANPSDEALYRALLAGAKGWLMKHAPVEELIEAIRRCARGETALDSRAQTVAMERVRHSNWKPTGLSMLTDQEQKILSLIAQGTSNREIARQMHIAEKTVKNYVSRMLAKLGVHSRAQAQAMFFRETERTVAPVAPVTPVAA